LKDNYNLYFIIFEKYLLNLNSIGDWGLGIGDWGLGVGGLGPNPQAQNHTPKTPPQQN
jgi:hypothetical protein